MQHSFVSFIEQADATDVMIDTTEVAPGEYDLALESFNTLSIAQSALKTDEIKFVVSAPTPPSFSEELTVKVLTVGQASSWDLPEINQGYYPLDRIEFEANANIASSLTFDEQSLQVNFDGNSSSATSDRMISSIKIDLIDTSGLSTSYTQILIVNQETQLEV